ncbi:MAG: D-alanine--D-alanine ligase [Vulcanimicrobiota bacterium]
MKIGITYDLRTDYLDMGFSPEETAEFDSIETIEAIDRALGTLGYETERIGNAMQLVKALSMGKTWDMVFNIAEGFSGMGREALVPALLDAYKIPYTFSEPLVLALTLNKGMTKRVIRDLKIPTPDFFVVEHPEDIREINLQYPLFAKPVAEGTSKGVTDSSLVQDSGQLQKTCLELLFRFGQPVLVEEFLPGREFTVGIVGTGSKARVIGAAEIFLTGAIETGFNSYSFDSKANFQEMVNYQLATDLVAEMAMATALLSWNGLGCRDGGRVDLRCDENGIPNFIEVNPLAGLRPLVSDLPILSEQAGVNYVELIKMIMDSALERINIIYRTEIISQELAKPMVSLSVGG